MKRTTTLLLFVFWAVLMAAQSPFLVKDINPGSTTGLELEDDEGIFVLDNIMYFVADDGMNGAELWRSDGTEDGTWMVKDIFPGEDGSSPIHFAPKGDELLFFANDGVNGDELWKTDGTEAGTVMVKDVNPGAEPSIRRFQATQKQSYLVIGDVLYFAGDSGVVFSQLWRSDGTADGTYALADVCADCFTSGLNNTSWFAELNDKLYFFASNDFWESDGTAVGTVKLMEISISDGPNAIDGMVGLNGLLYFSASDNFFSNREPWVSDGTVAGTKMLKDIETSASSSSRPRYFTAFGNHVYFVASDLLYRTDGTEAGTETFGFEQAGSFFGGDFPNFLATDELLYVVLKDNLTGSNNFMYATDGITPDFTKLLQVSGFDFIPSSPVANGDQVYFIAKDVNEDEYGIAMSDGSAAGTSFVNFGQTNIWDFRHLTVIGDSLYFYFNSNDYGTELMGLSLEVPMTATISVTADILCQSDTSGAVSVEVAGGTPPYSYTWSPSTATGANPAGLGAGTYSVTITDGAGMQEVLEIEITEPDALEGTTASEPEINGNDGAVSITVEGGTPPYTYLWDTTPPADTPEVEGLPQGEYTVTVTDANGCTLEETVVVDFAEDTDERFGAPLTVSPTLARGSFTILSKANRYNMEVALSDQLGRQVRHWEGVATGQRLDLSGLQHNLYFVTVRVNGQARVAGKLVVVE